MSIETFDLKEAAAFLKMNPEALRRKVASGDIPGTKPGKSWCFRKDDLAEYLRSLYSKEAKASWGDTQRRNQCHSTKEIVCGGLISPTTENEYSKRLGLQTKSSTKNPRSSKS